MDTTTHTAERATPWNKGKLLGQKPPLKLKEIWAIRIRLQLDHRVRELALFNLAIVGLWVGSIGLDPAAYGTHSLRRTKPTLIYRRTRNLRAVQLLLGHTKLDYVPRPTMSCRAVPRGYERMRSAGHSRRFYRLLRKASSLSSGRYRPGLPLGGVVLSRMRCFISRSASR